MVEQSSDGLSGNWARHRNRSWVFNVSLEVSGISLKACIARLGVLMLEVLTVVVMSCYDFCYPPPLNSVA